MIKRVNEGSHSLLHLVFRDPEQELAVPTTIEYRVDCETNGQTIRDWTNFPSIASEIDIVLTPEDNDSYVEHQSVERHVVTVRIMYGASRYLTGTFLYEVANLRFLS